MVVGQNTKDNLTNKQNPLIDTGQVTVDAFNALKNKKDNDKNFILGRDDKKVEKSPNHKVKVKVWTNQDDQTHTYFHSFSIDKQVTDFMGTCELRCPYDSDLMEYWEPIRQSCVVYGANKGDYKILFIGRVRELMQDGYELSITLQDYGWKFKQDVSQSYAKDNVLNRNGYAIMCAMFEALKIDSYVISESAKKRLKEVGINIDGNLTLNGQELKEMPDLIERLKESNPSELLSKKNLNDKLREKYIHNIENINYTLKYEEPTEEMRQLLEAAGGYNPGATVYAHPYASASAAAAGGGGAANVRVAGSTSYTQGQCDVVRSRGSPCANINSGTALGRYMVQVQLYNVGCSNDITTPMNLIVGVAKQSAQWKSIAINCLTTMGKNIRRTDGNSGSNIVINAINQQTSSSARVSSAAVSRHSSSNSGGGNIINNLYNQAKDGINYWSNRIGLGNILK